MSNSFYPLQKNDRVRHKDQEINKALGIMTIFEIKNGIAICGYMDYNRLGSALHNYPVADLTKAD